MNLKLQVNQWSTPTGTEGTKQPHPRREGDRTLTSDAQGYSPPVPAWVEMACSMTFENFSEATLEQLGAALKPSEEIPSAGETSSKPARGLRRRLSPAFDCWLMGAPWFWTRAEPINFAAQETASFRSKLLAHLSNLHGAPG